MDIRRFEDADEPVVIQLWDRCGLLRAWNDPRKDIARKKRVQPELFVVGTIDGEIVASAMAGYDGHRGWINYLAVDPSRRRQGLAAALMTYLEVRLRGLGCAKVNLQIRRDNLKAIAFYQRIGFAEDAVVSFGKRLERDEITDELVRRVLTFGAMVGWSGAARLWSTPGLPSSTPGPGWVFPLDETPWPGSQYTGRPVRFSDGVHATMPAFSGRAAVVVKGTPYVPQATGEL